MAVPGHMPRMDLTSGGGSSNSTAVAGSRTPSPSRVSVKEAEAKFNELKQTLSRQSSRYRASIGGKDEEKAEEEDEFDLVAYLRNEQGQKDEAGFKRKRLGVIFDDLTVVGAGGMKIYIRTFPDAIKEAFLTPLFMIMSRMERFRPKAKNLLENFNGSARPGEMVLVLGRPGSGCSTFLKTIANNRGGFLDVQGKVSYGGLTPEEIKASYKGEVVYNQEDDVHHATLTVAQNIMFALNVKTPSKLLPNQTRKQFKQDVMELLLTMLGISHTRNTMVGSATVRGVSGGERKRVSIAEMMTSRASVCSWDNSTRGLDASTALDYAKSLRIMTDVLNVTNFVSLYQAGEGIFEQFDKILVIDNGKQVYFGPTAEARQYFVGLGFADLPRQTTADYVTGCTDPNERRFQPGRDASNVPSTPEALEAAYKASDVYKRMMAEKEAYRAEVETDKARQEDFRAAVQEDKRAFVSKKSPYTVSLYTQTKALVIRQTQLKLQDKLDLYMAFFTSVTIALIVGSLFLRLPQTASGAFTRGGVIFISLLFNAFQAFNELPIMMMGRPVLFKQTNFAFYRPAALSLSSTIADAPFSMAQILLFSLIVYFMCGLYSSAGAFFAFYITIVAGFFSLASFFRLLGTMCISFDVAARSAAVFVSAMISYGGYLIPVFSMKRWLFWIYYINPVNYAFSSAMMNEFRYLNLLCDEQYIVPHNVGGLTQYPTALGANQVCTLAGSIAGNPYVSGRDYLMAAFEYDVDNQWPWFAITILFFIGFTGMQMVAVEYFKHGADAPAINIFRKEDSETKPLNERLLERKDAFRRGEVEQDLSGLIETKRTFTWEDVTYTVPVSGGTKRLLNSVYGYVKPGTLTALMGSSGAGKTTLLDVLANRKNIGVIDGSMLVDGRKIGKDFQRGTAYCEQLDVHEFTATVREAFRFSAYLRQPAHISKEEKDNYVEEIIQLLELEDLAEAQIGFPGFGIGVEARKRVTIGVELASKPQLLLFLDEPTSGLDGQSAYNIVRFLRKLAAAGQAILCTIHQPNALLFENFDRLLLLQAGGNVVYFGDIGADSKVISAYFARHGAECPPSANMAEYMLEAIGAGSRRRVGNKDWGDIWRDSLEFQETKATIEELKKEGLAKTVDASASAANELTYATSFATQVKVVGRRTAVGFYRRADYGWTRVFMHLAIALFVGLTFLQLQNSVAALQYRVFVIFYVTVLPAIIIAMVEPTYIMGRDTFTRESSSKMYSQIVFALTQLMAEAPYSLLSAVIFYLLMFLPAGFDMRPSRAGYQFFMVLIVEFFSVTLGQAIAALSPSIFIAALANPFLIVLMSLFCGVVVPPPNMPYFWRSWMYPLIPFTRLISGMVSTELHELPVVCLPNEFSVFQPPAGLTCGEWAQAYVDVAGGYIRDAAATVDCGFCQFSIGDDFYTPLSISFDTRWRDLGIFLAYVFFNGGVTLAAAHFLKYAKR